jgi:hypothetical protein
MSRTLAQLRTAAKYKAGMENSDFVTTAEWTEYLNQSAAELYDLINDRGEDFFLWKNEWSIASAATPYISSASSPDNIILPRPWNGIGRVRGIDYAENGDRWCTVQPFNFADRNEIDNRYNDHGETLRRYRIAGDGKIYILPEEDSVGTYRVWYNPPYEYLAMTTDATELFVGTLVGDARWDEYVILGAAAEALAKEESWEQVQNLKGKQAAIADRVRRAASGRQQPERVTIARRYEGMEP